MQLFGFNQDNIRKVKHYNYNTSDLIGVGNFSKVYKGINTKTSQYIAIKVVSLDSLRSRHLQHLIYEEISILKQCRHPSIIKFHEAIKEEKNCYIITELCKEGNLESRVNQKKWFSQEELSSIISDVYQGLQYLREMGVCHRDIKAANIFMSEGRAKIADFGLAKFYKQGFKDLDIGSPLYMSPQGIIYNTYGEKTDVWAFGILIYQLIHGTSPFVDCKTDVQLKNAVTQPIPQHKFNPNIPAPLKDLIKQLLTIDEHKRPSINQLFNNNYIRSIVSRNGPQSARRTSNSGLKVVQPSKLAHNKSVSQVSDRNKGKMLKEGMKIHIVSEYGNQKSAVELGGTGSSFCPPRMNKNHAPIPLKNLKNFKEAKGLHSKNYYLSNEPISLKEISHDQTAFQGSPGSINDIKRYRFNSTRTIDTKQSEEEALFLNREHVCPSHLRK